MDTIYPPADASICTNVIVISIPRGVVAVNTYDNFYVYAKGVNTYNKWRAKMSSSDDVVQKVWGKGTIVPGYDPNVWRKRSVYRIDL